MRVVAALCWPSSAWLSSEIAERASAAAQEFIRVGYYVNNEYADAQLREAPPEKPRIDLCATASLTPPPARGALLV